MNRYALWVLRIIPAAVLITVGYLKLTGGEMDVRLFTELGMEPHGRIIIGVVELTAGLLLLSPQAASGALLAVGVMCGAIIAHATVLGFSMSHIPLLALVLACSAAVLYVRRRDLPIVGKTLGGEPRLP